jgi:hypothetical protein
MGNFFSSQEEQSEQVNLNKKKGLVAPDVRKEIRKVNKLAE